MTVQILLKSKCEDPDKTKFHFFNLIDRGQGDPQTPDHSRLLEYAIRTTQKANSKSSFNGYWITNGNKDKILNEILNPTNKNELEDKIDIKSQNLINKNYSNFINGKTFDTNIELFPIDGFYSIQNNLASSQRNHP